MKTYTNRFQQHKISKSKHKQSELQQKYRIGTVSDIESLGGLNRFHRAITPPPHPFSFCSLYQHIVNCLVLDINNDRKSLIYLQMTKHKRFYIHVGADITIQKKILVNRGQRHQLKGHRVLLNIKTFTFHKTLLFLLKRVLCKM